MGHLKMVRSKKKNASVTSKTCHEISQTRKSKKAKSLSTEPVLWDIHSPQVISMRVLVIVFKTAMGIKAKIVQNSNNTRGKEIG